MGVFPCMACGRKKQLHPHSKNVSCSRGRTTAPTIIPLSSGVLGPGGTLHVLSFCFGTDISTEPTVSPVLTPDRSSPDVADVGTKLGFVALPEVVRDLDLRYVGSLSSSLSGGGCALYVWVFWLSLLLLGFSFPFSLSNFCLS